MNKQIEEMALEMASEVRTCLVECECKDCGWYKTGECPIIQSTKRLAEHGYRKSTDVAREIFAEIDTELGNELEKADDETIVFNYDGIVDRVLDKLKKKYESEGAE